MTACKSNCKNLATALEMYASDEKGRYPLQTATLTAGKRYLTQIPTCPAAGKDVYSPSYVQAQNPDAFTFFCSGDNHARAFRVFGAPSLNYPQYTAVNGLIEHPPNQL